MDLNDGSKMPLLGFGTFQLVGKVCEEAVATAIGAGYRMIDTAQAYGNEAEVGAAVAASGIPREELFLVTKVDFKAYEDARTAVEGSLRRLRTDYVDLLLLHWPFANYYAAWHTMEALRAEGKVRSIGVSNFTPGQLLDLIAYNEVAPSVDQIETNLYCQRRGDRTWLDQAGVAQMAYAPLGQGARGEMFTEPVVVALAEKYGKTPAQILLRFLTQRGIAVIPRSSRPEHIRENAQLFDFALTEGELAQLTALDRDEPYIGRPQSPELIRQSFTW